MASLPRPTTPRLRGRPTAAQGDTLPLAIGTVLENRYRFDTLLGEGGMGAVYRAWHLRLDQYVAIKENATASPASARQFEREAKMMARLRHPNLPHVIDHFVTPDGAQYLVMDFIEGEDLEQMVARRPTGRGAGAGLVSRTTQESRAAPGRQVGANHRTGGGRLGRQADED